MHAVMWIWGFLRPCCVVVKNMVGRVVMVVPLRWRFQLLRLMWQDDWAFGLVYNEHNKCIWHEKRLYKTWWQSDSEKWMLTEYFTGRSHDRRAFFRTTSSRPKRYTPVSSYARPPCPYVGPSVGPSVCPSAVRAFVSPSLLSLSLSFYRSGGRYLLWYIAYTFLSLSFSASLSLSIYIYIYIYVLYGGRGDGAPSLSAPWDHGTH